MGRSGELLGTETRGLIWLGYGTTIYAGICGSTERETKRIIAYSTSSQIGLMFIATGRQGDEITNNAQEIPTYHLFGHGFIKALLFIIIGLRIQKEQDLRKRWKRPTGYIRLTSGFCVLSLTGFPYMTGFYTKELIIGWSDDRNTSLALGWSVYWTTKNTIRLLRLS